MGNSEYTKQQIRLWIEESIKKAKNPDKREIIRKKRLERANKIKSKYGF